LTNDDKQKLELKKEMFVIIKTLDVIEKMYNFDKVSESDYNEHIEKYLKRYDTFKK
jgi:hypothetical protein